MANLRADNLTGTGGRNAITGSVYFQGYVNGVASDYLKTADLDDYDMGTGDFTFECWLNAVSHVGTNSPNFMGIFSSGAFTAGGFLIQVNNTGPLRLVIPLAAGGYFEESAGPSLWGNWNHIAVVKTSNVIKGFVNGIEVISASHSVGIDFAHGGYGTVGENCYVTYPGDYPLRGHVSNLRLIKGTALYTAAFTPPTEKLTAVDGTVLLCCQDSDDPTQEATGKTITGYGRYEYLSGTNLVTNGSGNSVSGWTDANTSTFASTGGRIQVTRSGGSGNCSYQAITTVAGQQYTIRANIEKASGSYGDIRVYTDSGFGTMLVYIRSNANTSGLRETTFTATTTTTHIVFVIDSNSETAYYSDISVIAANRGKAPKVLPPVGVDAGVVFDGDTKVNTQSYMYFPTGDTSQRGRGTALFGGGYVTPAATADIEYLSIVNGGITTKWGNLSTTQLSAGQSLSSTTRQLIGGGWAAPANNVAIEYVEIATSGNSITFGNLLVGRRGSSSVSNDTRGIFGGGYISPADAGTPTMDYVTIASKGNAADFGDLSGNAKGGTATGSTTRAVFALGNVAPVDVNTLEYVTIATLSNYTNFGELPSGSYGRYNGSCSSNTRGIFAGGHYPTSVNIINYITIASTGNAEDFGDLFLARGFPSGTSNGIRGVFMGGTTNPARQDTIDSVIIATTGNAVNWGDMRVATQAQNGASSDSHGGLS